jgi:inorganic phosphate transporter, PiT family
VAHFISSGSMSFARGLNDTPKIVALLLVIESLGIRLGMLAVAFGMAVVGIVLSRILTLPIAAILAGGSYWLLNAL